MNSLWNVYVTWQEHTVLNNVLLQRMVFPFSHTCFILSWIYCAVSGCLMDILSNTSIATLSFFLSRLFYHNFASVSCVKDCCTRYLNISFVLKVLDGFFLVEVTYFRSEFVKRLVLKIFFKYCNFQPLKIQKSHKNFWKLLCVFLWLILESSN